MKYLEKCHSGGGIIREVICSLWNLLQAWFECVLKLFLPLIFRSFINSVINALIFSNAQNVNKVKIYDYLSFD